MAAPSETSISLPNSKRLRVFLGANQLPIPYLDQNLLPVNSHVNTNLDEIFCAFLP
jgi:hypothetical protein